MKLAAILFEAVAKRDDARGEKDWLLNADATSCLLLYTAFSCASYLVAVPAPNALSIASAALPYSPGLAAMIALTCASVLGSTMALFEFKPWATVFLYCAGT